jgi:hypothetical protein
MTVQSLLFVINGNEEKVPDTHEAERLLALLKVEDDLEIEISTTDGASLSALINSRRGWLMFSRFSGDVGFSSRNFSDNHSENNMENFVLANGQEDAYPSSWTFARNATFGAILEFVHSGLRPIAVDWHDDGAK